MVYTRSPAHLVTADSAGLARGWRICMAYSLPDTVPGLARGSCFGQQRVHHTRLSKMCVSVNRVDATCHHCEFTFTEKTNGPPQRKAPHKTRQPPVMPSYQSLQSSYLQVINNEAGPKTRGSHLRLPSRISRGDFSKNINIRAPSSEILI